MTHVLSPFSEVGNYEASVESQRIFTAQLRVAVELATNPLLGDHNGNGGSPLKRFEEYQTLGGADVMRYSAIPDDDAAPYDILTFRRLGAVVPEAVFESAFLRITGEDCKITMHRDPNADETSAGSTAVTINRDGVNISDNARGERYDLSPHTGEEVFAGLLEDRKELVGNIITAMSTLVKTAGLPRSPKDGRIGRIKARFRNVFDDYLDPQGSGLLQKGILALANATVRCEEGWDEAITGQSKSSQATK